MPYIHQNVHFLCIFRKFYGLLKVIVTRPMLRLETRTKLRVSEKLLVYQLNKMLGITLDTGFLSFSAPMVC